MDIVPGSDVDDFGFFFFDQQINPLKEFNKWIIYATCGSIIVSLVSIGLFFKQNFLFPWIELIRCLTFLGYQLHFKTFIAETGAYSLLMNSIRLLHLYSAVKCQIKCVSQMRDAMQKDKIK
uniref:Uncharacterized protein n=1 Tax=Daphnia galeata TaxID=27404 RepID=A0A8J2WHJ1_9CRUS|nr:unnamed protein product [Daphnia galeata]